MRKEKNRQRVDEITQELKRIKEKVDREIKEKEEYERSQEELIRSVFWYDT